MSKRGRGGTITSPSIDYLHHNVHADAVVVIPTNKYKKFATTNKENTVGRTVNKVVLPPPFLVSGFLCPSYVYDVYQSLRENEDRNWGWMTAGCDWSMSKVSPKMRHILVNWLVEVSEEYRLGTQTLYLAVYYLDRFLHEDKQGKRVSRRTLQLFGVASVLIASKFEEVYPPALDELVYITDGTYEREQIVQAESIILDHLHFELSNATVFDFLKIFLSAIGLGNCNISSHAEFLAQLILPHHCFSMKYKPSKLAASIVCLSIHSFDKPFLVESFQQKIEYSKSELIPCLLDILECYKELSTTSPVKEKFRGPKHFCVSSLAPPQDIPFDR